MSRKMLTQSNPRGYRSDATTGAALPTAATLTLVQKSLTKR